MKTESVMTEEQLIRQAIDALIESLGIMEATRFLTIKRESRLESMDRHRLWQSELDKDTFFDEIFTRGEINP